MAKRPGTRSRMAPAISQKSSPAAKEAVAPSHPRPRTVAEDVTKGTTATIATAAPVPEAGAPRRGEEEVEGGRTLITEEEEVALRKATPTGGRTKTLVNTTITVPEDGRVMGELEMQLQLPLSVRRMAGNTSELPRTATAPKAPPEAHQAVRTPKPGIRRPGHRHSSSQLGRQVHYFSSSLELLDPHNHVHHMLCFRTLLLVSVSNFGKF